MQCVVLKCDDFWLTLSRFSDLHIELVQGRNIALADLFDPIHARNVLAAFGRPGRLPDEPTKEQESFLDLAIKGLAQDGRVICVRLALFAEMVKGARTPATLKAVGGKEGSAWPFWRRRSVPRGSPAPRNRLHQERGPIGPQSLAPGAGDQHQGKHVP